MTKPTSKPDAATVDLLADLDSMLPPTLRPRRRKFATKGVNDGTGRSRAKRHKSTDLLDDLLPNPAQAAEAKRRMDEAPITRRELLAKRTPVAVVVPILEQRCTCGAVYTAPRFTTPLLRTRVQYRGEPARSAFDELRPTRGLATGLPVETPREVRHLDWCHHCISPDMGRQLTLPFPDGWDPLPVAHDTASPAEHAYYQQLLEAPNHYPKHATKE